MCNSSHVMRHVALRVTGGGGPGVEGGEGTRGDKVRGDGLKWGREGWGRCIGCGVLRELLGEEQATHVVLWVGPIALWACP